MERTGRGDPQMEQRESPMELINVQEVHTHW
jgi:hypothetical protein